jgi:hypothetical protein
VEIPSAEKRNLQNMYKMLVNGIGRNSGHDSIIGIAYSCLILTVLASFHPSTFFDGKRIFRRRKALTMG